MPSPTKTEALILSKAAPIPVELFSKDHWSTFAYVESRCVDGKDGLGTLECNRMRCNPSRHPLLSGGAPWREGYSTRLSGFFDSPDRHDANKAIEQGLMAAGHDDWDCLDDLEAAGLVEVISLAQCVVRLTSEGLRVSSLLRQHKAQGGNFARFSLALEAA